MDEQLKHQLTGAVIWFVLTAWLVGDWYAHPVNFSPNGITAAQKASEGAPIVQQPLRLEVPVKQLPAENTSLMPSADQPQPDALSQVSQKVKLQAESTLAQKPAEEKAGEKSVQTAYLVKVAAYFTETQANQLASALNELGYDARYKVFKNVKGQTVYSVRVGPYATKEKAQAVKEKLDQRFYTKCKIEPIRQTEKN